MAFGVDFIQYSLGNDTNYIEAPQSVALRCSAEFETDLSAGLTFN